MSHGGSHLLALLSTAVLLCGQQPSANGLLARAQGIYAEQGARQALPVFEQALAAYRVSGDRGGEAITLGHIGNCHKHLGDRTRALEYLERALALKRQLGLRLEEARTDNHIGLLYLDLADYAKASASFRLGLAIARELSDDELAARIQNNLGLLYDEQGDYRRSLEAYQQAAEAFRRTGSPQGESAALGNIGGVHLLLGHFREAKDQYLRALTISEKANLKLSTTQDLGNLALCEMNLGNTASAITGFDRAIRHAQEGGFEKEEADWRKGKGSALLNSGKYNQALLEYAQAIRVYEKSGHKQALVEALGDRGSVYLQVGDIASARRDYQRALQVARRIGHPRGVVSGLAQIGAIEYRLHQYTESRRLYTEALQIARRTKLTAHAAEALASLSALSLRQGNASAALRLAGESVREGESAGGLTEARSRLALGEAMRSAGDHEQALGIYAGLRAVAASSLDTELGWRSAYGRGLALEALKRTDEAIDAYKAAVSIIESVRGGIGEDRYRAGYMEERYAVYVSLVRLLLRMNEVEQAFLYAERLRARSLASLFDAAPERPASAEEKALRLKIGRLRDALEREHDKPAPELRADAVASWASELAQSEREYQNLLDDLRTRQRHPATARGILVPGLDELRSRLPDGCALVEYLVAEDGVSLFVLKRTGVQASWTPIRKRDLTSRVELLQDLMQRPGTDAWKKPAMGMWRILLAPLASGGWLKGVTSLYLVPHGVLHYLPFGALVNPTSGRVLLEDYELTYLPAAAMLVREQQSPATERTMLAMAPERSRLAFAQQEARMVSGYFGAKGRLLSHREATEQSLKTTSSGFDMLHLATHAHFNPLNPLLSSIELEAGGGEDGRLEVHEILHLKLHASLVTLSACQTASGSGYFSDLPAGEEFISLARAFLAAGTTAVLSSLWEVNDRSTLELMKSFYGSLQPGQEAGALAESQRRMLRTRGKFQHPYYWAPFVVVGGAGGMAEVSNRINPENHRTGP